MRRGVWPPPMLALWGEAPHPHTQRAPGQGLGPECWKPQKQQWVEMGHGTCSGASALRILGLQ